MDDRQSRRLEALSAHVDGLKTALESAAAEDSLESLRRLARSLAHAAEGAGLPEVADRARAVQSAPEGELHAAARSLVDSTGALRTSPERDGIDGYFAVVLTRL